MAAWGGVVAWTGFEYSGVTKTMSFNAINGNWFWSNGYAYGTVNIKGASINIEVLGGKIALDEFTLKNGKTIKFKKEVVLENGDNFEFEVK